MERCAMLSVHIGSLDLSMTRDLWELLIAGLCAVLIAVAARRPR